tara:strand:- start:908 stop:1405 length:498 start_codon:yes stop_codon:yes gene_type:complete
MAEELTVAQQMEALKTELTTKFEGNVSELQSKYDTALGERDREISLLKAGDGPKSTEIQETRTGLESKYAQEDAAKAAANALTDRDAFWVARNKAIYEDKIPEGVFNGLTTVEEINRQTAVVSHLNGKEPEKAIETVGGGSKIPPSNTEKLTGLAASEAFLNARE